MKDLRAEKEHLTIQKDAQYDTYHYFRDYHKELQTVCANVDNILGTEREAQREQQQSRKERTLSIKQKASPGLSCERLGLTLYHITLRTGFELSRLESNQ